MAGSALSELTDGEGTDSLVADLSGHTRGSDDSDVISPEQSVVGFGAEGLIDCGTDNVILIGAEKGTEEGVEERVGEERLGEGTVVEAVEVLTGVEVKGEKGVEKENGV